MSVTRQATKHAFFTQSEVIQVKKKMRNKEAEFEKERAVLKQKIELYKTQVAESEEREANQKKMYETMISALKNNKTELDDMQKHIDTHLANTGMSSYIANLCTFLAKSICLN
jgi:chromosome segregation ATPase